jgi:hypothetical protein
MTFVIRDRILVTSTTTGTGTFTLGAATAGYQDFSSIGNGNTTYYTITNGTDFEVGIGTYTSSGTTLARTQVLESSNSDALVDWPAGTKNVFVPQPAINTQGTAPTGDNSSIGTDQVAFNNFQKNLQASVNGGVTFNNNGVAGIGSTYALAYTTVPRAFIGGVLNSNGEIHFVPLNASVGQKVNTLTGVVSTYSLVNAKNYFGGVLAPNGDIHFIPEGASRGQKVSLAGVVSTYSIIYLGLSDTYRGGVVAPNGDIHFIPHNATVGQKVSTAGVASTYSLVYTTANAYQGGVLAPNGDIYFVPYSAAVGQKISAAGVVSTYSLVYTQDSSYSGGVLSPNGDIHFINYLANRGQKISSAGVVSTYSLIKTGSGMYAGGVLAPNGDIHFVPFGSNIGQKISSLGVVSTYSLASTSTSNTQYWGGVLAPNGDIHFVPYFDTGVSPRGQKISTCPAISFGIDTCLSSYLNKF